MHSAVYGCFGKSVWKEIYGNLIIKRIAPFATSVKATTSFYDVCYNGVQCFILCLHVKGRGGILWGGKNTAEGQ